MSARTQYRTVDTRTLAGLKRAEWYKAHGWTISSVGLFRIAFHKTTAPARRLTRAELEALATDEALGVTFDADGASHLPDGQSAVCCTALAERVIALVGRGTIYGWQEGTNPTAIVAGPATGARLDTGQGHDFAILDGRWLVDPWAKLVECSTDRAVFDLEDAGDRAEVRRLYGTAAVWLRRGPRGGWQRPAAAGWRALGLID